ncbi:MAG: PadR family transcriptional regulator [Longimicrobiales bacterium]|nr:PadR family transcriptional regulator [Longimicrobiales bacterium]
MSRPAVPKAVAAHLPLKPTALQILLSLAGGERYGYAIIREIADRTDGRVELHPGALYRFIRRLDERGLIEELEHRPVPESEDDERRRYYGITPLGREVVTAEVQRMGKMMEWARDVELAGP